MLSVVTRTSDALAYWDCFFVMVDFKRSSPVFVSRNAQMHQQFYRKQVCSTGNVIYLGKRIV